MATMTSATVIQNFEEYVGDTVSMLFDWSTGATVVDGVVTDPGTQVDLTGYQGVFHVKNAFTDADPLLTGTLTLGGVANNITGEITDSQTTTLGAGKFVYYIELTDTLNKVNTFAAGKLKLKAR